MSKEYYVYAASIWDEVVYVGMGSKDRLHHVNSGSSHNADLNRLHFLHGNIEVKKIKEGMTKEQALKEELHNINLYLPVCNKQGISLGMYGTTSVKKYTTCALEAFHLGVVDYIASKSSVIQRNSAAVKEVANLLVRILGRPKSNNPVEFDCMVPHIKSKLFEAFPEYFGKDAGKWEFLKSIVYTVERMQRSNSLRLYITSEFIGWYINWYDYCFSIADEDIVAKELAEKYSLEEV